MFPMRFPSVVGMPPQSTSGHLLSLQQPMPLLGAIVALLICLASSTAVVGTTSTVCMECRAVVPELHVMRALAVTHLHSSGLDADALANELSALPTTEVANSSSPVYQFMMPRLRAHTLSDADLKRMAEKTKSPAEQYQVAHSQYHAVQMECGCNEGGQFAERVRMTAEATFDSHR